MNEASASRPTANGRSPGERVGVGTQRSDGAAPAVGRPSFSSDEGPLLRKVFRKLCDLSDTLEEIEGWIESRDGSSSQLYLPNSVKAHQVVVTPENLDIFVAAERAAIVEQRARAPEQTP